MVFKNSLFDDGDNVTILCNLIFFCNGKHHY
jgi:hypothetical protein